MLINAFFLIDLTMFTVVFGLDYVITQKKVLLLEAILQCLAIWADVLFFAGGSNRSYEGVFNAIDLYNVIALLRILRMLYLLGEVRQFQTIIVTFNKFQKPFGTMMISLYTVFYFFSLLG